MRRNVEKFDDVFYVFFKLQILKFIELITNTID